jgi:hypothetical protein
MVALPTIGSAELAQTPQTPRVMPPQKIDAASRYYARHP